jgi:ABC-type Fe3+ transport system substrate-binding protein
MERLGLDIYDELPKSMMAYLRNYGFHFNKDAFDYAVSFMKKNGSTINKMSKEDVDNLLQRYGIVLKNNVMYDAAYVANMCRADFFKSSVPDEQHLAMFVRDYIDDEDQVDGFVFNRWYADMMKKGIPIDWEDLLG